MASATEWLEWMRIEKRSQEIVCDNSIRFQGIHEEMDQRETVHCKEKSLFLSLSVEIVFTFLRCQSCLLLLPLWDLWIGLHFMQHTYH